MRIEYQIQEHTFSCYTNYWWTRMSRIYVGHFWIFPCLRSRSWYKFNINIELKFQVDLSEDTNISFSLTLTTSVATSTHQTSHPQHSPSLWWYSFFLTNSNRLRCSLLSHLYLWLELTPNVSNGNPSLPLLFSGKS